MCLPRCLLALVLLGPVAPALAAAPPGCGEAPEPVQTYVSRAEEARRHKDHAQEAEQYWNAWCRSGEFSYLVRICEAHLRGHDRERAREILQYAERRALRWPSQERREALQPCRQGLLEASQTPRMPAAQPAAPDPGPPDHVRVTVLTDPPGARVYIDNQLYGLLGTPVCILVPRGLHDVRIEHPGYIPRRLRINFGPQAVLSFPLEQRF
ncbi:MAG: PEGA domain-containing protein [Myxococcales bacterium]|nr:PEGA domain-containing protein [Myxococcota bacterium]MDW8281894.1 PEGA domain-containing protein [Myxococcales bacterium]